MRFRSRKEEARYRKRRPLVQRILQQQPMCQRCMIRPSSEVHEILSRARGGDILNEANCAALCHECHVWITTNPARAHAEGWLIHSWEHRPSVVTELPPDRWLYCINCGMKWPCEASEA